MTTKTKGKKKLELVADTEDMKRMFAVKPVKIKLADKDRVKKGKEASHLQKELDEDTALLNEKTKTFKEFKKPQDELIKEKAGKIAAILRELETGEANSNEECGIVYNYKTNEVITYFPKNSSKESDIVERRTMDAKERQLSLIPEEAQAIAAGIPEDGMEATE